MDLNVQWYKPITLLDGSEENLIYTAKGLDDWLDVPGIYMFARVFNDALNPLYIGKAENIALRAKQHFKNSTMLMNGLKNSGSGSKVFVPGEFKPKPGQNTKKCIALIERALIDHALTEGYELLNVQGARTLKHSVKFSGFLGARNITGKRISFKAKG